MNRKDVVIGAVLAAALGIWLLPFARGGVEPHHDGIMLKPALDVLSGQVLFRDTFTQYGALTTYLLVAALWFEPTLLSLRYLTIGAYMVSLAGLFAVWRQFLPRPLAVLACGLFVLFLPIYERDWLGEYWVLLPWSSSFALMFQVITLVALCMVIREVHAARWSLVAGAAAACVFWCRQPVGVITIGCLAASWLALHWAGWAPLHTTKRNLATRIVAGFLLVNGLIIANLALHGALSAWWYQNFTWPAKWARVMHTELRVGFFLFPAAGAGLLLLLLAVVAPGLLQRVNHPLGRRTTLAYYLGLAALVVWQHERVLAWVAWRSGGWSVVIPVVTLGLAIACLVRVFWRRTQPHPTEYHLVAAVAAVAAGALLQYYPLPDPWHVWWAMAPALGLVVYVFWRASQWPAPVAALVLAAAFAPLAWTKLGFVRPALDRPLVTLERPAVLRGMRASAGLAQRLDRIAALVEQVERQRPDIPSVLIGNDAMFTCFTKNLTNPIPYHVTWEGLGEPADSQQRWNFIHARRPLMFLQRARWDAVAGFYRKERYVPILYFEEDALEVAIPQEIADALGVTTYGAPKPPPAPDGK